MAGSPLMAHLHKYPQTNDIGDTVAAADAPHEHLPMEIRLPYYAHIAPTTSNLIILCWGFQTWTISRVASDYAT